jgi:hypothetical protein
MSGGADLDLSRLEFRFAKRMPETPHWYTVRSRANEADYVALFHIIQEKGAPETFGARAYRYWRPGDGYKYWTMTSDVTKSFVINRAEAVRERKMELGLARLRASPKAEAIRQSVLADNAAAVAEIAASRDAEAERRASAPKAPAPPTKPAALSAGAEQLLRALFRVAGDGWVDQKAIPHGLPGRTFPGYLTGLTKRGLVEARWDGRAKFSARMTLNGLAYLADLVEPA